MASQDNEQQKPPFKTPNPDEMKEKTGKDTIAKRYSGQDEDLDDMDVNNNEGVSRRSPLQALEYVEKLPAGDIFILRDFQRFLEDVSISRKLRNLTFRSLVAQ